MLRTHTNGELTAANIGETVTLTGWVARRRDHGGVAFVDLRDRAGVTQCVFHNEDDFEHLRNEYVLRVTGQVTKRPEGNENPNLATGEIEVEVSAVEVLNTAAPLPFQIDEHVEVGEEARLRYRYLDLRRPEPARIMRLRSDANRAARNLLADDGYLEIETPTLTRSTPEGARDFLVPARLAPGSWYALPQSPQLFKQLLQVGGIEKYYQIARCYRDEDFRADRQPEFTQLDIEASFVDQDDIIDLGERIVEAVWNLIDVQVPRPIRRMTYTEAMEKYGTDKPDLRFGLELTELTDYFANTTFRVFKAPYVGAVVMPGGASQPRRTLDAWQEWAKQRGAKGLAYVLVQEDGELTGPVAKNITDEERAGLAAATGANPGDCIFESAAEATESGDVALGHSAWTAVHHAFTAPKPEFLDTFDKDPGSALAYAYDIVCNGNEIGGGSIRIHRRDVQERVFAVMGIGEEEAQEKFGFLLDAFKYGAPPMGGIAFGWDRIISLLAGVDSIREVIAFPKTGNGYDPLTAAPAPITPQQRKEAGVDFKPKKDDEK